MAAAGLLACLLGAFAGYLALQSELEAQFHGGVLDEDRAWVLWHDIHVAAMPFAVVGLAAFAALGLLPLGLHRRLRRVRG